MFKLRALNLAAINDESLHNFCTYSLSLKNVMNYWLYKVFLIDVSLEHCFQTSFSQAQSSLHKFPAEFATH
jgi:hypothetical protein